MHADRCPVCMVVCAAPHLHFTPYVHAHLRARVCVYMCVCVYVRSHAQRQAVCIAPCV